MIRLIIVLFLMLTSMVIFAQPEQRINIQRNLEQATHNGNPVRFGGIPVGGVTIITDSLGRQTYVRDTVLEFNNKLIRFYIRLTNPLDTLYRDTIGEAFHSATVSAQTLSSNDIGDTIGISGGNDIGLAYRTFAVDDFSDIYSNSFPLNSWVINKETGAQYLVQADSVAGYTNDSVAVIPTGSRYAVLQPQQGQYDVTWFGAVGDGVTDNGDIFTRAVSFASGRYAVHIPSGIFLYSESINVETEGIILKGVGSTSHATNYKSELKYTGTASAIQHSASISDGSVRTNRHIFEDFSLSGTDSAEHGIDLDVYVTGGSINGGYAQNVRVQGFSQTGSYGIYLTRCYGFNVINSVIRDNYSGIYLGNESVNCVVRDGWISSNIRHGVYNAYGGNSSVKDCIITSSLPLDTMERGIYSASGDIHVEGCLFEGLYCPVEAITGRITLEKNKFNASDIPGRFTDGVRARLVNNILPANQRITTSLGSEWIGDIEGSHVIPSITADNPIGFATMTKLDGSAGAFTLDQYQIAGVPSGPFTLIFLDDSVTVAHNETGTYQIHLKDRLPFKGYPGDKLILQKVENAAGVGTLTEVSRIRAIDNSYQARSTDYNVVLGDHQIIFSNIGASDTVTFTLPGITNFAQKPEFTFVRWANQVVEIKPDASRRIRGSNNNATSLFLNDQGSSVTVRLDSIRWDIIASNGIYSYASPDAGFSGEVLSGVGTSRIVSAYTADRILYGTGTTVSGTDAGFLYYPTGTNDKYLSVGITSRLLRMGVGDPTAGLTNQPGIFGHTSQTLTSNPSIQVSGYRYAGTFESKTDATDLDAPLVTILGAAYRNGSYRAAGNITIQGGSSASSFQFAGIIGFATSNGTAFARRATIQRNGDFYLGDGLPTNDLASPSSKLLIRGNGTTTGYSLLIEDSAGDDKFTIQDNGTVSLPVAPTLNNAADSIVVRNNVTGAFELRSASTISGGGGGDLDTVAVKSSNTVFTEDMTLAAIGLDITLEAGEQYEFEGVIFISGDGDSKFALDGTATATTLKTSVYHRSSTVNYPVKIQALASTTSSDLTSATMNIIEFKGIITVNAGGTFGPRFAQNTDTDSTTAEIGSYISVRKI